MPRVVSTLQPTTFDDQAPKNDSSMCLDSGQISSKRRTDHPLTTTFDQAPHNDSSTVFDSGQRSRRRRADPPQLGPEPPECAQS